jgi:hypothetical protein
MERFGATATLGISALRRYVAQTKTAEARNTLQELAKRLMGLVATAKARGEAARFPPSAPPVPTEVPHASKWANPDWSHPTWRAIGFLIEMPIYYRYQIVTSPDRKHVVVRAEGDLNGDGKTSSLYEVALDIDNAGAVVVSPLTIKDGLE